MAYTIVYPTSTQNTKCLMFSSRTFLVSCLDCDTDQCKCVVFGETTNTIVGAILVSDSETMLHSAILVRHRL